MNWNNFLNNDTLLSIRTKINDFNNSVVSFSETVINTVGDLSNLTTTDNSNTVEAINEVNAKAEANATDIADVNTRVDDLSTGGSATDKIALNEGTAPAFVSGTIFYEDGEFKKFGKYTNDILNADKNIYIEVFNNTGADFYKGDVLCYDGGIDTATQKPTVKLAKADSFDTSFVIGIVNEMLPAGEAGYVVSIGTINNLDLSAFSVGDKVALSEFIEGTFDTNKPTILSYVGTIINNSSTVGALNFNPSNNIKYPVVFSKLSVNTDTIAVDTTPVELINYGTELNFILTSEKAYGKINVSIAGYYNFEFSISGTLDGEEEDMTIELYDKLNNIVLDSFIFEVGRGSNVAAVPASFSFSTPVIIYNDNTDVVVRLACSSAKNWTTKNISFSMTSLKLGV